MMIKGAVNMRKVVSFIFALVIFSGYAFADEEILFHSVPWMSNEIITRQKLEESGLICGEMHRLPFEQEDFVYLVEYVDTGFICPDYIMGLEKVTYSSDLKKLVKGKIAGYAVENLRLTFAYDGEYKLIAIKVDLLNSSYDDIKTKLTKVYGEGLEMLTDEGISSVIWKGDNDSAVVLYTQGEGLPFDLVYGRIDAVEILKNCLAPADPDDVSGL